MFKLDSILSTRSYGDHKYSSEVGVKVTPSYGVPFVILGTVLSDRPLVDTDLHKPLKRVFSKKSHSYFFILEG